MHFYGKVVVLTGANSSIGGAAAVMFAKQSAKLVLVGQYAERLEILAAECESTQNMKPLVLLVDLENYIDVGCVIKKTLEYFGRIDVLVNNAGIGKRSGLPAGVRTYDQVMAINVRAPYLLTSFASPHIIASKGNIVNVSSVAELKPSKDFDYLPYCISKAALDQFTKCLAVELSKYGVRVNSVNPGGTKPLFPVYSEGSSTDEVNDIDRLRELTYPLGKMVECEEVADMILYLASDRARSITGSIFVIDNGQNLL